MKRLRFVWPARLVKRPRLELDYIAAPQRPVWPGVLVLAVALALAAHLALRHREARESMVRLEAQSGLLLPQRKAAAGIPRERLETEARAAEAVARELSVPWAALIGALERASMRDVALLQLQPDAQRRMVHLTAAARDREAMFTYMRRLSAARGLTDVHLVTHQMRREDARLPIEFALEASLQ